MSFSNFSNVHSLNDTLDSRGQKRDNMNSYSEKRAPQQRRMTHSFETNINGLKGPSVNIEHLESLTAQDFPAWKKSITNLAILNQWTPQNALIILKIITNERFHAAFEDAITLEDMLEGLSKQAFGFQDYRIYITELQTAKMTDFANLHEYTQHMETYLNMANECLKNGNSPPISDRELFEYFLRGLSGNYKRILTEKGILDVKTALHTLQRIEQTTRIVHSIERTGKYTNKAKRSPTHKVNNSPYKSNNIWCSFHQTNTHKTADCIAKKKEASQDKISKHSTSHYMSSTQLDPNQLITTEVNVNGTKTLAIIDTGAEEAFINPVFANNLGVKVNQQTPITVVMGNGLIQEIKDSTVLKLDLPGITTEEVTVPAYILHGMPENLHLGLKFLRKNNINIDIVNNKLYTLTNPCIEPVNTEINTLIRNFLKTTPKLGTYKHEKHTIPLVKDYTTIRAKPFSVPLKLKKELDNELRRLLKEGIIRESISPFSSPAFIIPKKDGSIRLVIDYRKLNSITIKEQYPLPRIEDILNQLEGSKRFSQIDLNAGYHQIDVDENDKYKTSFVTPFGQFEFNKMPFGATNAPRSFQRAMNNMFSHYPFVKVYLDDILIHSKNQEDHVEHVKMVLAKLKENGFSINPEKCSFNKTSVKYLGCIITDKGITPDTEKMKELTINTPKTLRQLQKILGFFNYFRQFIPKYSQKTLHLTEKLKCKNGNIQWTIKDKETLEAIKNEVINATVLTHPDLNKPFTIKTDASDHALGATLEQEGKPVRYFSYKLKGSELNYTIMEKELYAIVKAVQEFRNIIYGSELKIFTDNRNATFMKNSSSNRVLRWKNILDDYNYTIEHIPGKANKIADFLSRNYSISNTRTPKANNTINNLEIKDHKYQIEPEKITEAIRRLHLRLLHPGVNKLYGTMLNKFNIKNMKRKIRSIIEECITCKRIKRVPSKTGKITGSLSAETKNEKICADILGPVDLSDYKEDGKGYVLTIMDTFSRYAKFIPLKSISSRTVNNAIKKHWLHRFPTPKTLVTDCGTQFTSNQLKETCVEYNIRHSFCSPYNPTANGIAERVNGTILNGLRLQKGQDFKKSVKKIEQAYNTCYHSAIGTSPSEAMKIHSFITLPLNQPWPTDEHILNNLKKSNEKQIRKMNRTRKVFNYSPGTRVMVKNREQHKLADPWLGPGEVQATRSNKNSLLITIDTTSRWYNIKDVKPCGGQDVTERP